MRCRYSENDIALAVEGDLSPERAYEIQSHLMTCEACRDLATELRESQATLKGLRQDTVSAAALASVRSAVLTQISIRPRPLWGRWVYGLAGAVFFLVIFLGWSVEMRQPAVPPIVQNEPLPPPAVIPTETPVTTAANVPLRKKDGRRKPQGNARTQISPEPAEQPKPLVVKLLTDDPNIVIYWLIDQNGGAL